MPRAGRKTGLRFGARVFDLEKFSGPAGGGEKFTELFPSPFRERLGPACWALSACSSLPRRLRRQTLPKPSNARPAHRIKPPLARCDWPTTHRVCLCQARLPALLGWCLLLAVVSSAAPLTYRVVFSHTHSPSPVQARIPHRAREGLRMSPPLGRLCSALRTDSLALASDSIGLRSRSARGGACAPPHPYHTALSGGGAPLSGIHNNNRHKHRLVSIS